jgi:hypothetical protein
MLNRRLFGKGQENILSTNRYLLSIIAVRHCRKILKCLPMREQTAL